MRFHTLVSTICGLVFSLVNAQFAMAQTGWKAPAVLDGAMNISAEELVDLKAEFPNVVIIDTSVHDATNSSGIEGAHNLPERALSPIALAQLAGDKFTPVVFLDTDANSIHCYKAVRQAVILGYSNVYWFRGGLKEWLDKGLPVVRVEK